MHAGAPVTGTSGDVPGYVTSHTVGETSTPGIDNTRFTVYVLRHVVIGFHPIVLCVYLLLNALEIRSPVDNADRAELVVSGHAGPAAPVVQGVILFASPMF
jgi:hypothetical protein